MSGITTLALLPVLLVVLSTTLELGALRVVAARARSAADLAVLVAVNDQSDAELARSGRLAPASDAADVARDLFAANLESIAGALAATPVTVASAAIVTVDREAATVRIAASVPVRTPVLGALLFRSITAVAVRSSGGAR